MQQQVALERPGQRQNMLYSREAAACTETGCGNINQVFKHVSMFNSGMTNNAVCTQGCLLQLLT